VFSWRVICWEHQVVPEQMQLRLDHASDMMRVRRQTVEHPFGTIKAWMGATHFLTRTTVRLFGWRRAFSSSNGSDI
jgi:hypothetical protein